MHKRTILLTTVALTVVSLLNIQNVYDHAVFAQTRRRQPRSRTTSRRRTPQIRLQPLTEEEKKAIADYIEAANEVEFIYRYALERFAEEPSRFPNRERELERLEPDWPIHRTLSAMIGAYGDARTLYGAITGKGMGGFMMTIDKYKRSRGEESHNPIQGIVQQYGVGGMSPYQAVAAILNYASQLKTQLHAMLLASPTVTISPKNTTPTPDYDTWEGAYIYDEKCKLPGSRIDETLRHSISIYSEDGKLNAHIVSQNLQGVTQIKAFAQAEGNKIHLYFDGNRNEGAKGSYKGGDMLLTLELITDSRDIRIRPQWRALKLSCRVGNSSTFFEKLP